MPALTILRLLGIVMILETCNGLVNDQLGDKGTLEIPPPYSNLLGPLEYVYWRDVEPGYVLELKFSNVHTFQPTTIYSKGSGGDWEVGEVVQGYFQSPFTVLIHSVEEVAITIPGQPGSYTMEYNYYETCSHYCEISVETKSYKVPCNFLEEKYKTVCNRCRNTGSCSPIFSAPTFSFIETTEASTTRAPVTCPAFDDSMATSCSDGNNLSSYCVIQCDVGYHPRSLESPHLLIQCLEDLDGRGFWDKETNNFCLSVETITALCIPHSEECPYNTTEMLNILDEENIFDQEEKDFLPDVRERSLGLFPTEKERCLHHCGIFRLRTGELGRYPCGIFKVLYRQQRCMDCRYSGLKCLGISVAFS